MAIEYRAAAVPDLPAVVAMLDQEFIEGRGRHTSMAARYPSCFDPANAANIFVAQDGGTIAAALIARRFSLNRNGKAIPGAMIGGVCTLAQRRGEGLGSGLLRHAVDALDAAGAEFAVLWTAQPRFYERLGWVAGDRGMLGDTGIRSATGAAPGTVYAAPAAQCDLRLLEGIRARYLAEQVVRERAEYAQQPVPADRVDALCWQGTEEHAAYALVGNAGGMGVVYELAGAEEGFEFLWRAILASYGRVLVNDCAGSASQRWLARHADLSWAGKPLAMWWPFEHGPGVDELKQCYVPYFDRIGELLPSVFAERGNQRFQVFGVVAPSFD